MGSVGESHLLQVNINRLGRKLEEGPTAPRYILTKAGVGYKLALLPPVSYNGVHAPLTAHLLVS